MKVTILGCGGAGGVPMVSYGWGTCDPSNPRNRRRRPSILVEEGGFRILVDTSPDLREQLLDAEVRHLDAVLFTHAHADHLHGIDDLREVNRAMQGPLDIYADATTLDEIRQRFGYTLTVLDLTKMPVYKPLLVPHLVTERFALGPLDIQSFPQDHGYGSTTGFRFGPVAYTTDLIALPERAFEILADVPVWIVGCLQEKQHMTHANFATMLEWRERIRPGRTILTHMSVHMDFDHVRALCPPGVEPAYDGLVVEI